jgi:16S rRNA processing protein RimM
VENNRLLVGRINGVYGVKGWVKIYSFTDPIGNILSYRPWWVKRQGQWIAMNVVEAHEPQGGKAIVAHLEGINSREQARELMGCDIALDRAQLPEDDDGFYWADLIDCRVKNVQGEWLGRVSELIETGAHDVLRVKGDKTVLIPFVMEVYVTDVDLAQRVITVNWDSTADDV